MAEERTGDRWQNWSGSVSTTPRRTYYPETEADLVAIVDRHAPQDTIRVVGAGHSFTPLGVTPDVLVSMERYTGVVSVDRADRRAEIRAGTRLAALNRSLAEHDLAMENLGDIDRQRLAGAISTGTHGTGTAFGILSTQIASIRLVTADGSIRTCSPTTDPDVFRAAQVSLGALGIISTITLDLLPAYTLKVVERPMAFDDVLSRVEEFRRAHRHFEFFWYPEDDVAQVKTIDETDRTRPSVADRTAAWLADASESLLPSTVHDRVRKRIPSAFRTVEVAPSHEAFPSVRDIKFNEMEYALPRADGPAAARRIRDLIRSDAVDVSFPIEFRDVRADDVFLSPAYDRESTFVAVHKYYKRPYDAFFERAEAIFREYDGRPHWGKHHTQTASTLATLYPKWEAFQTVRRDLDPDGVFCNDYLRTLLEA